MAFNFLGWLSSVFGGNTTDQQYREQYGFPSTVFADAGGMDEETALKLSAVYRAVQLTNNIIGATPLKVQEKQGDKWVDVENELWDLLQNKPNAIQTGQEFRETLGLTC